MEAYSPDAYYKIILQPLMNKYNCECTALQASLDSLKQYQIPDPLIEQNEDYMGCLEQDKLFIARLHIQLLAMKASPDLIVAFKTQNWIAFIYKQFQEQIACKPAIKGKYTVALVFHSKCNVMEEFAAVVQWFKGINCYTVINQTTVTVAWLNAPIISLTSSSQQIWDAWSDATLLQDICVYNTFMNQDCAVERLACKDAIHLLHTNTEHHCNFVRQLQPNTISGRTIIINLNNHYKVIDNIPSTSKIFTGLSAMFQMEVSEPVLYESLCAGLQVPTDFWDIIQEPWTSPDEIVLEEPVTQFGNPFVNVILEDAPICIKQKRMFAIPRVPKIPKIRVRVSKPKIKKVRGPFYYKANRIGPRLPKGTKTQKRGKYNKNNITLITLSCLDNYC